MREIVIQPLDGKGAAESAAHPEIQKEPHDRLAVSRRQAAVVGGKSVSIVDLDAGKVTAVCSLPDRISSLAWSRDGTTLAVACLEDSIVLYQPGSKSRRVVKGPLGMLWVAFDPSGRFAFLQHLARARHLVGRRQRQPATPFHPLGNIATRTDFRAYSLVARGD